MKDHDTKRITRLSTLLTLLQTKRILTATFLSDKLGVSIRTIYRYIRILEQSGVPILTESGKGYSLMEGYRIPPVMFTEIEANALITVEQLILKNTDSSLIEAYTDAISKVKAVLRYATKDKLELLSSRMTINPSMKAQHTSNSLALIQTALTAFTVLHISYHSAYKNETSERDIEPFALYYNQQEQWTLIAWCRLRKDYRMFRLENISKIDFLESTFSPHQLMLQEFLDRKKKNFSSPDTLLS